MAILKIASIEPLVGLQEIISEIQNIREGKPHVDSDSQKTDLEKERYAGALRRRQLSLILSGKMKPENATELKALFEIKA